MSSVLQGHQPHRFGCEEDLLNSRVHDQTERMPGVLWVFFSAQVGDHPMGLDGVVGCPKTTPDSQHGD